MDKQELVKKNNEMREQLTTENEAYYSKILIYMRLNIKKNEQKTEEVLIEILSDLLQAQKDGISAADYFGKDPQKLCEDILAELPDGPPAIRGRDYLGLGFLLIQFFLFNQFFEKIIRVSFLNSVIPLILIALAILFLLVGVKNSSFVQDRNKGHIFIGAAIVCYFLSIISGMIESRIGLVGPQIFLSVEQFAVIYLIIIGICLLVNLKDSVLAVYNYLSVGFMIFAILTIFHVIDPQKMFAGAGLLFSVLILAVMVLGNRLSLKKDKK